MIRIEFSGDAETVVAEMQTLLNTQRVTLPANEQAEEEPAKPARKPRASKTETKIEEPRVSKTETKAEEPGKPSPEKEDVSDEDATSPGEGSSAADEDGEVDLSEATMRSRITAYSAKAGPIALTEMQKAAGAPNGKFSEVLADPERLSNLHKLLADVGF